MSVLSVLFEFWLELSGDFCIIVDTWTGIRSIASIFMWVSNLNIGPQNLSFESWVPGQPNSHNSVVSLGPYDNFIWSDDHESFYRYIVCKKVCVDLSCTRKGVVRSRKSRKVIQYNWQTIIYKALQRKLKIDQHEPL